MQNREQLTAFVTWWRDYCEGHEKSDAQEFIRRLLQAFGYATVLEAKGQFEVSIRISHTLGNYTRFADFLIPGLLLIEMKSRGENLTRHYDQLYEYWEHLVPERPKYCVLCNFDELWIYDFNRQLYEPLDRLKVEDLPQRTAPLAFLFPGRPQTPVFGNDLVAVTREAADSLAKVYNSLRRREIEQEVAQRFILQCMLALFAEDIDLVPNSLFSQVIDLCLNEEESSYDLISQFFRTMNQPNKGKAGRFRQVDYFNGGLFEVIEPLELTPDELRQLREAARQNWSKIRPAIFGTIFEQSLAKKERHQVGAHFTHESDIKRIVDPVIVRPWREAIESAATLEELVDLQHRLCAYQVLDPACGSGNFLYVAYREMKKLEMRLFERIREQNNGRIVPNLPLVNAHQFWGLDIKPFAVELAKVTLMIAKKLAIDEFLSPEAALPLDKLDANIRADDALFAEWPAFDACIGNPPYLGAKRLKVEHGVDYINKVREAYPDVPGNADYCVYWFRKTHQLMQDGTRAGLVGTNTIRQNYSRIGGLDYIVENDGHIYDAVSSMPWPGEAVVHVSIVCWSKGTPPTPKANLRFYEGKTNGNGNGNGNGNDDTQWRVVELPIINSALSEKVDVSSALSLDCNTTPKRVFQGQTPGHKGFILTGGQALAFIKKNPAQQQVVFPYLTGDDLLHQPRSKPSRWVIDFEGRDIIEARAFKEVYAHLERQVLPDRQAKAKAEATKNAEVHQNNAKAKINRDHQHALEQWWLHFRGRLERKTSVSGFERYIVCSRVTKRPVFDFVAVAICPSDALQTFAFADDYSFGILQSTPHTYWFIEKCSTLGEQFRYTPESIFDTFPWPQHPTHAQVQAVAEAARALHTYRREVMQRSESLTLGDLYRTLEVPGKNPLRDLHNVLDQAVIVAYGFDAGRDILEQLLKLNERIALRLEAGKAVQGPGIPSGYPNPAALVSEGCIQPPDLY